MLITRLCGGLGNQMFQYAVGKTLADGLGQELKLDISGYASQIQGDTPRAYRLQFFSISPSIATEEEIRRYKYPYGLISKGWRYINKKIFRKHYTDYHPEVISNPPLYLDGFFQSEKYFLKNRNTLVKSFSLKPTAISEELNNLLLNIKHSENSISLHVRRGDYFANSVTTKIHGVDLSEYYKRAISLMRQRVPNPHFFVFSDDIEWVKNNLQIDGEKTYVSNPNLEDYQELAAMSHCRHNIIANSSFSWWGAWLNQNPEKIVTAPSVWTVKNTDHPNIVPDTWIKL